MGNFYSDTATTNINQTQVSSTTQTCNENASSIISGTVITAIDSHLGDITLSSTISVGDMKCVLAAVSKSSAESAVADTSKSKIASLPFQLNIDAVTVTDTVNTQSLQQSIIDQSCTESAASEVINSYLTFIDSSTGNIKVASTTNVSSFSCNLQASTYQSAVADVSNASSSEISNGCCIFDIGMLIPVVLGLVGLVVVSKLVGSRTGGGEAGAGGGGGAVDARVQQDNTTAGLIAQLSSQVANFSASPSPQQGKRQTPPSASTSGTRANTVSISTSGGGGSAVVL